MWNTGWGGNPQQLYRYSTQFKRTGFQKNPFVIHYDGNLYNSLSNISKQGFNISPYCHFETLSKIHYHVGCTEDENWIGKEQANLHTELQEHRSGNGRWTHPLSPRMFRHGGKDSKDNLKWNKQHAASHMYLEINYWKWNLRYLCDRKCSGTNHALLCPL